ncbi:hypothetical protein TrLO_g4032 [Triparma laevis f. longispina]|uniref:Uncharacterized protein n=1 Tax=Triparma laevis f. longispina TaxID=1714387 RepID=A0A9W7EEV5_9STRA|nr:hypothetical protein TrLO_g4032 [Triparma laevis f. longispina]
MHTPEFYRHFLDYVPVGTLMWMRLVNKELRVITEQFVLAGKMRGVFIVHDRRDGDPGITVNAIKEMHRKLSKQSATFTASISTLSAQTESLHASIASIKQSLQTLLPPPPTTTKSKHPSSF